MDYGLFIESQFAHGQLTLRIFWFKFGHDTAKSSGTETSVAHGVGVHTRLCRTFRRICTTKAGSQLLDKSTFYFLTRTWFVRRDVKAENLLLTATGDVQARPPLAKEVFNNETLDETLDNETPQLLKTKRRDR